MLSLIQESGIRKFVMHCYSEDTEYAKKLLSYSDEVYFGFSGILTYKNAQITQDAAYTIPLDRILIETDAPFLAPQPVRGQINEPANIRFVFEKLCEIRPEDRQAIENALYQNSCTFYSL